MNYESKYIIILQYDNGENFDNIVTCGTSYYTEFCSVEDCLQFLEHEFCKDESIERGKEVYIDCNNQTIRTDTEVLYKYHFTEVFIRVKGE